MFVYPYLKDKKKAQNFANLGVFITTVLVAVLMIVAIVYFSPKQLEKTIWATLNMLKIVRVPNLERFEFIGISLWMVIMLPNLLF
ncbi:GerAB/ArcD/ProY family transporter [Leuconostoc mesenteroides]|uniref:GerAB/ArcD/ProY family transporter n=1 Tax=Leuconostoc mesenteroides TaxID=1245 RepID=UPI001CBEBEDE|nr:GerAB/ArcD/ProY family transporter [Leuconostoc mesenteroides]